MRAGWVFVGVATVLGCDGGNEWLAPPNDTVFQTSGNKSDALTAARTPLWLESALRNRDLDEVQWRVFSLGSLAAGVTIAPKIAVGGSRTSYPTPMPPPQALTTSCDDRGCEYDDYRNVETAWSGEHLIEGNVHTEVAAGTRTIDIALQSTDVMLFPTDLTTYVNGHLEVTPTSVNGAVTVVDVSARGGETPSFISYNAVTFEPAADPATIIPVSGEISAEWTSVNSNTGMNGTHTRIATVRFP